MSMEAEAHGGGAGEDPSRRDFIYIASGAFAAAGALGVGIALVQQMAPSAAVRAFGSTEYDVGAMPVGSQVKLTWRAKPVFVRHRTEAEIADARSVDMGALPDKLARRADDPELPATDENRALNEKYLVMLASCTHFGCIPFADQGEYTAVVQGVKKGGWFCPCHGSHYDTAGRIRKGPAPENLHVPPYEYISDTVIKIG